MVALAVLAAQIVEPFRILAVAILFFMTRLAENRGAGWLALAVGCVVLSWFFAFVFERTGQFAWDTATVGVISNAVIVAILLGLLALYRRFF